MNDNTGQPSLFKTPNLKYVPAHMGEKKTL